MAGIPEPSIERLCRIHGLCHEMAGCGTEVVSSRELSERVGVTAEVIRKDIGNVGDVGRVGLGYAVKTLGERIEEKLGLGTERSACVVGLGRLGGALLEYGHFSLAGIRIVAGFDSSINRLETIRTPVPVYPAHELSVVVRREAIAIGLLAVPATAAQSSAEALAAGGVCGILNFTPVVVGVSGARVVVRSVDIVNELKVVVALLEQHGRQDLTQADERSG